MVLEIDGILTVDTGEEAGKRGAGSQPGCSAMWMDGGATQNSGYNSKCFAFSHATVTSHQALQTVVPRVRSTAALMGEEAGTMLWRALNALNSRRSWEPFSVSEQRLILFW